MNIRTILAALIAAGGLVVAAALFIRQPGPALQTQRLHLADATAIALDTVTIQGRRIDASIEGRVVAVSSGGTVWVATRQDAFPLRFQESPELDVEDRVLVTGRLRGRGGRRWLAVTGWSRVESAVSPPGAGL